MVCAGTIAVIDGGGVLLGQCLTGGQLWVYIYELHQSHAFNAERFTRKTWGMFVHAGPFVAVMLVWRSLVGWSWTRSRGTGARRIGPARAVGVLGLS